MIFGFIEDGAKLIEDAVDVGTSVATMGMYGELNKENVSRLISAGLTVYAISEATGVAVDLIEKALEE